MPNQPSTSQPGIRQEPRPSDTNSTSGTPTVLCSPADSVDPAASLDLAGKKLGKYELRKQLGAGGMGTVFLGFDPFIEREVAVKVIPPSVSDNPTLLQRFLGEARAAGQLSHPNTIAVHDIGESDGLHYIVMELARGGSVADRLADEQRLSLDEACRIVIEAGQGLAAAHSAGLIHRDIKPENLMLTDSGTVKIVDFGLSKSIQGEADPNTALTMAGQILGTPHYMSPEQFIGGQVDERSDIYSLGATFYHLLTGEFPFGPKSVHQLMYAHLESPPPDPLTLDPELPIGCATIIAKAMAKSPDDRYAGVSAMIEDVQALLSTPSMAAENAADGCRANDGGLPSVLIVEPSKFQARIVQDAFKAAGVESVTVVNTGAEAASAIEQSAFGVFVTARHLPDTKGDELIRQLQSNSRLSQSMFVLVSMDRDAGSLAGLDSDRSYAWVSKQSKPDELLRAIHACTDFRIPETTFSADPTKMRLLLITANGSIPADLAQHFRELGILDVKIVPQRDFLGGGSLEGEFDLVLAMSSGAGESSERPTQLLDEYAAVFSTKPGLIAIVVERSGTLRLQFLSRAGLAARCDRVFDRHRFERLLDVS